MGIFCSFNGKQEFLKKIRCFLFREFYQCTKFQNEQISRKIGPYYPGHILQRHGMHVV